jgi:hypothetical protein
MNKLNKNYSKIQKKGKSDSNSEQDINIPTTDTPCDCDSDVFSAVPTLRLTQKSKSMQPVVKILPIQMQIIQQCGPISNG